MTKTLTGLEKFASSEGRSYRKASLGYLGNQASVGPDYVHGLVILDQALPGAIKKIFGPKHGWAGEKQDNMVESDHDLDARGRPIYSLYGETRRPTPEMLAGLTAVLIDLVDVGTRVYTFAHTLSHFMEEAAKIDLEIIILDRPNPIGGRAIEGNLLADDCLSFVGLHPIPMRHGLTLGELAIFINTRLPKSCPLKVIKLDNWRREMYFQDCGLPWVLPSPNLPGPDSAWVYPGQALWAGTNISEGRATTRPFSLMGAPFLDSELLLSELKKIDLPGVKFRAAQFQPTFHKWAGEVCRGLELYPVDITFKPYLTSLCILEIILKHWPDRFEHKKTPYEYEYERRPIDLILGRSDLFDRLAAGPSARQLEDGWLDELQAFEKCRPDLYQ